LNELRKYFEELDSLNKKKYINDEYLSKIEHENNLKSQKERSTIIKYINTDEASKKSSNIKSENQPEKVSTKKLIQNNIHNNHSKYKAKLSIQKKTSNNSSYNYLMGLDSKFLKNNLNPKSIGNDVSGNLYNSNIMNNSNKVMLGNSFENNIIKGNNTHNYNNLNNNNESEIKEDLKDAILNKSNKKVISIIKKYIIIMIIFTFLIIVYSLYKIRSNSDFNNEAKIFLDDFQSITDRFHSLYFFF
jgi:hypothetical protein